MVPNDPPNPKPRLIGPGPAGGTTDQLKTTGGGTRTLPYDVLRDASRRLGVISLLGAVLWIVATAAYHLASSAVSGDSNWMKPTFTDAVALVESIFSLALFVYSRKSKRDPKFILDLGLVYMVSTSAAIALCIHSEVPVWMQATPVITWVGVVILTFAAIVPNSPNKTLYASLIAALMNPLSMYIAHLRGSWHFGPLTNILVMHYPDFLLAGIAVVISNVITRLSQQVGKEREMGSYRLVSLLGKGGMGEVWRAQHRMLARDAAIKLIQPHMLTGVSRNATLVERRFEQEARATAMLRSPHTVELYDFGVTDDGIFYYVMEMLDGIDLESLVRRFGPQPPGRVVNVMRQACRSLADAHRRGMIHRDIKPGNIFLCRMGSEYDFVKILDFGLVKVLDQSDAGLTGEGATTGTPAYMAPEVSMSNAIDGRTDLYSLGCVAYWMLTGRLVFEERGATAMMLAHVQKEPAAPSHHTEMPVPEWLDRIILMCLAKNKDARPPSADVLGQMLESRAGDLWSEKSAEQWWAANLPETGFPAEHSPATVTADFSRVRGAGTTI